MINISFPNPNDQIPSPLFAKIFGFQFSSKPFFYLPTGLLCINRIVIVIEEVNVKVFSSGGGWFLLVASSHFWQKCLRNPKKITQKSENNILVRDAGQEAAEKEL